MPPIRLVLLAHGASAATRRGAFATGEEPLEPVGAAAADGARGALPSASAALASPAATARRTAEALGLAATVSPILRDLDAGSWIGRSIAEIAPAEAAAWLADPTYTGHGGESLVALHARIADFLAASLDARGTTIAVTHAAVVRAALVSVLGAPASGFWRIDVPPLAALVLGADGRRWSLRGLGPLAELPAMAGLRTATPDRGDDDRADRLDTIG